MRILTALILSTLSAFGQSVAIGTGAVGGGARGSGFYATTAAGGGPDVWYDVEDSANGDSPQIASASEYYEAAKTVTTGGSATKIRVYIHSNQGGTHNIKVAIYSNAGTLLGQGTTSIDGSDGYYKEVALASPVTVTSSTTYKLAVAADHADVAFYYKAGTGSEDVMSLAYADFPENPLGTPVATFGRNLVIGVYVD